MAVCTMSGACGHVDGKGLDSTGNRNNGKQGLRPIFLRMLAIGAALALLLLAVLVSMSTFHCILRPGSHVSTTGSTMSTFFPSSLLFGNANMDLTVDFATSEGASGPAIANSSRLSEIVEGNAVLTYLPGPDILLATMARAGSRMIWKSLCIGLLGNKWINFADYMYDKSQPCWGGRAVPVSRLSEPDLWRVLTGPDTLRVAVQRDPYARLISAFKSKYSCEAERFGTDAADRDNKVRSLCHHANLSLPSAGTRRDPCMTVSEFATALDRLRENAGQPGFVPSLRYIDHNILPQEYFLDEIEYHLVLDVSDWMDRVKTAPILDRLKHADVLRKHRANIDTRSSGDEVLIPEKAATSLHRFALLSKTGKLKYMT